VIARINSDADNGAYDPMVRQRSWPRRIHAKCGNLYAAGLRGRHHGAA
jgi:hypothetical protein